MINNINWIAFNRSIEYLCTFGWNWIRIENARIWPLKGWNATGTELEVGPRASTRLTRQRISLDHSGGNVVHHLFDFHSHHTKQQNQTKTESTKNSGGNVVHHFSLCLFGLSKSKTESTKPTKPKLTKMDTSQWQIREDFSCKSMWNVWTKCPTSWKLNAI